MNLLMNYMRKFVAIMLYVIMTFMKVNIKILKLIYIFFFKIKSCLCRVFISRDIFINVLKLRHKCNDLSFKFLILSFFFLNREKEKYIKINLL
jgi:hypothetical protein